METLTKPSILERAYPGARIDLHYYGESTIVKIGRHWDTKEMIAEFGTEDGAKLHLSMAHLRRLLDTPRVEPKAMLLRGRAACA